MNIFVITGQTATGKTQYAVKLAKEHNGELINADSRQIYQKLTIVTGKEYIEGIPIWLYDIVDPKEPFSSHEYAIHASEVIVEMIKRGKTPIIVGGTWFYIQNLLYGTIENTVPPNNKLRKELAEKTVEELQELLQKENKELFTSLNNSEQHNPQRLIRRIEKERFQNPPSGRGGTRRVGDVIPHMIGFQFASQKHLSEAIATRVEKRLEAGAVEEVQTLLSEGYTANDPGLRTIGYQQIIAYLNDTYSYEDMKHDWITKEIQYAKRQLSFMKQDKHIKWKKIG